MKEEIVRSTFYTVDQPVKQRSRLAGERRHSPSQCPTAELVRTARGQEGRGDESNCFAEGEDNNNFARVTEYCSLSTVVANRTD